MGGVALFFLLWAAFAELTDKVYVFYFLWFGFDACAFEVVPP